MPRLCALITLLVLPAVNCASEKYFTIQVVDQDTGRGVPLVELKTVNNIHYYTDSNGIVAFDEPGLMNQTVFFYVRSHGYEFAKDGFGFRGIRLDVKPAAKKTIKIKRLNIAERLYRMTGGGIYRDTVLVGEKPPIREPVLNGQVFGSDSVVNVLYRGKLYWFWGDTNKVSYPLGNFFVPGATSELPGKGGLDPEIGVNLSYFLDENGFAKPTAKMPGPGPCWIGGLVVVKGDDGEERLFAQYARVEQGMRVYQRGLVEFNDEKKQFEKRVEFDLDHPLHAGGHPFKKMVDGVEYIYFANAYPHIRVRATPEALLDQSQYEGFTCFKSGTSAKDPELDRTEDGAVRYSWKKNAPLLTAELQNKLIQQKKLKASEGLLQLRDIETGKTIVGHAGSVYWTPFRQRWIMITTQIFGESSMLGEIWYVEADRPEGPWVYARKILTHDKYSFYNPKQHPMFDKENSRIIYFEGTYTHTFSGNPEQTPRYDYNQIMYKLDLQDPRLILPVAIYQIADEGGQVQFNRGSADHEKNSAAQVAWYAPDRPFPGTIPILHKKGDHGAVLEAGSSENARAKEVLFYAIPSSSTQRPAGMVPLYDYVNARGAHRYSTDANAKIAGYRRQEQPLCYVWEKPWDFAMPADQ